MKFVSWNVNGLRACVNKGFLDTFHSMNADFFCLQETKLQEGQIELDLPGYEQYWNYAQKKGYSGTAIFTKHTPLSVTYGLGVEELDTEGRLITLEYEEFYLVCCYTPNAQRELARIDHRLRWEAALQEYLAGLDAKKPVVYCGDLNVAHNEIDLKNPSANRGNAGFSDEERGAFSALLDRGFTDSFRHLYPDATGAYSWWSYMFNARKNNAGWRIDYFVVSDRLAGSIHDATIHPEVMGSDHCPVGLDLNISCNGSIWTTDTTTPNTQPEKKADGDSSAGHIHKLIPVAVSLVLTAALLIPIFAITGRNTTASEQINFSQQSTAQPTSQSKMQVQKPLVSNIVNHGNGITHFSSTSDDPFSIGLSSYLRHYYATDEKTWELVASLTDFHPNANFFVELIFDKSYLFTTEDLPIITIENCETGYIHFYYDENHRIAGCFVSGYAESDFQLYIATYYRTDDGFFYSPPSYHMIDIILCPDPSTLTSDELFNYIKNTELRHWTTSSVSPAMLIQDNTYVQEFFTRPEAISILLYDYEYFGSYFSVSYLLLSSEQFQSIMSTDEKSQFIELRKKKHAEGIYGSPIAIPI